MTLAAWENGGSAVLQVDGQRPSVSWLVETCHARTISKSNDIPRIPTPLVPTPMARRTMREPGGWHRTVTLAAWENGGSAVLQVDGERPSVSWLVELFHARKIGKSNDIPRSPTPLVTAVPSQAEVVVGGPG